MLDCVLIDFLINFASSSSSQNIAATSLVDIYLCLPEKLRHEGGVVCGVPSS